MREGFTFCGVDIADIGLHYAPEIQDTYVYRPSQTENHIETFEGHNGGYYYGNWKQPKEFILRCYFEETHINKGILSKVYSLFRRGKAGKLIFQKRPWCYYYATVIDVDDSGITNYLNGLITITMQAMYPFARCDTVYSLRSQPYHENIMANTALYDIDGMAPQTVFSNITTQTSIVLGNPGTERARLGVVAAGDAGTGILITNNTTNQSMKLVAFSSAKTTAAGKEVYYDGINGKTTLRGGGTSEIAFLYHDYGMLELEPSYPAIRDLYVSYAGTNTVTIANILTEDMTGKYIYAHNDWYKIVDQPNKHTLTLNRAVNGTGQHKTMVMLMNEITISPVSTMNLSKLAFEFKPTFA